MPEPFGSFGWICQHAPLPQCNLFFNQLYNDDSPATVLPILFPRSSPFFVNYSIESDNTPYDNNVLAAVGDAGTGVGANCEIPHVGHRGSVGDVPLIVLSAVSILAAVGLWVLAGRRKAAVGRVEWRLFLSVYALHSAFQIITMSSIIQQATTALTVLSAIHLAIVSLLFWLLIGNALVATQIVEDGTPASLAPLCLIGLLFFAATLYISLDTGLHWTEVMHMSERDIPDLRNMGPFVLTLLWPALAAVIFTGMMVYISLGTLREGRPALLYVVAFVLFAGGKVILFLESQPLCTASHQKINGAFLTSLLDTTAVGVLHLAWQFITEDDWNAPY